MRVLIAEGREWLVVWPLEGCVVGGVKGGSLCLTDHDDHHIYQTDYSRQMPFVTGAKEETLRRERNRGRVRLYRLEQR